MGKHFLFSTIVSLLAGVMTAVIGRFLEVLFLELGFNHATAPLLVDLLPAYPYLIASALLGWSAVANFSAAEASRAPTRGAALLGAYVTSLLVRASVLGASFVATGLAMAWFTGHEFMHDTFVDDPGILAAATGQALLLVLVALVVGGLLLALRLGIQKAWRWRLTSR